VTGADMRRSVEVISAALVLSLAPPGVRAAPGDPTREELAKNSKVVIELASKELKWEEPAEPLKIVGPLHFVGTRGLGAWLFATSEGLILLNTGMPSSGAMIAASIRKLGFRPEDIRILLNGHAHLDHAGALAELKRLSGAQLAIMREDVAAIEDGGKSDFHYGNDLEVMGFPPAKVDRVLGDGDTVRLGQVVLTALHTPGHTRGATTWMTELMDGGRAYVVVFPDGTSINPGYRVAKNPSYPGIEADFRRTLHRLEMLRPDIWFSHHPEGSDLEAKRKRAAAEGVKAWVDPEGYRRFVAKQRRAFEDVVDAELGVPKSAAAVKPAAGR
jgi:metallo-beta-lactamase class B